MPIFQESLIESQRIFLRILCLQILFPCLMQINAEQRISVATELNFPQSCCQTRSELFFIYMLIAPFLSMIDGELPVKTSDGEAMKIDITKIEEAIEKGRGYYEFVATVDGKEVIFRFNRSAFRNSYTMSDLPKMQLTYYAIHVGKLRSPIYRFKRNLSLEPQNHQNV